MMPAMERAAMLLTLIRRLEEVMRAEGALLREMRLSRLQSLQEDKAALAHAYEAELRRLCTSPDKMAALEPEQREALALAMRGFQAAAESNRRQLEAARRVVEGIVRALGDSAGVGQARHSYRPGPAARSGQILSLALNRQA